MIQITPQMRVLVAIEPVDFRCGIDGLGPRSHGEASCRIDHRRVSRGIKRQPIL